MLDDEFLAELRQEAITYMVEDCVVSETTGSVDDQNVPTADDGAGGLIRGSVSNPGGTSFIQRNYKCRVTIPTSHNQTQENSETLTSDTLTMAQIVLPWNAIVFHTSKITVTYTKTGIVEVYQVTHVEPHSEALDLHVYAVRLGV